MHNKVTLSPMILEKVLLEIKKLEVVLSISCHKEILNNHCVRISFKKIESFFCGDSDIQLTPVNSNTG